MGEAARNDLIIKQLKGQHDESKTELEKLLKSSGLKEDEVVRLKGTQRKIDASKSINEAEKSRKEQLKELEEIIEGKKSISKADQNKDEVTKDKEVRAYEAFKVNYKQKLDEKNSIEILLENEVISQKYSSYSSLSKILIDNPNKESNEQAHVGFNSTEPTKIDESALSENEKTLGKKITESIHESEFFKYVKPNHESNVREGFIIKSFDPGWADEVINAAIVIGKSNLIINEKPAMKPKHIIELLKAGLLNDRINYIEVANKELVKENKVIKNLQELFIIKNSLTETSLHDGCSKIEILRDKILDDKDMKPEKKNDLIEILDKLSPQLNKDASATSSTKETTSKNKGQQDQNPLQDRNEEQKENLKQSSNEVKDPETPQNLEKSNKVEGKTPSLEDDLHPKPNKNTSATSPNNSGISSIAENQNLQDKKNDQEEKQQLSDDKKNQKTPKLDSEESKGGKEPTQLINNLLASSNTKNLNSQPRFSTPTEGQQQTQPQSNKFRSTQDTLEYRLNILSERINSNINNVSTATLKDNFKKIHNHACEVVKNKNIPIDLIEKIQDTYRDIENEYNSNYFNRTKKPADDIIYSNVFHFIDRIDPNLLTNSTHHTPSVKAG